MLHERHVAIKGGEGKEGQLVYYDDLPLMRKQIT